MSGLVLHAHPFSSYCQKAAIAFYEKGVAFELKLVADQDDWAALAEIWPIKRFPLLTVGDRQVPEASIIIEFLEQMHPEPALIPADPRAALDVRMMDRIFDNYVMEPMQKIVGDALRPEGGKDAVGVERAHALLETSYAWLETRLAGKTWACGEEFTLADCAAGPSLFYADWVHAIPESCPNLRAYRARLNARPSMARAIDEARQYRAFFPLGAPDRD